MKNSVKLYTLKEDFEFVTSKSKESLLKSFKLGEKLVVDNDFDGCY